MPKINGGYFIKARCIKNSAIYKAPPYVREIWDYLLREANHSDQKYNGYIIKRGQLFRSYGEIRDDLSWKIGYRTERYNENQMKMGMRYLMKQLMITLTKQPRGNIITICNYDFFQNPKNYDTTSDTTSDTTNGQPMDNQGVLSINKNEENDKKDIYTAFFENAEQSPEEYITKKKQKLTGKRLETFNLFWVAFNDKRGRAEAADSWLDIPKLTNSLVDKIIMAAKAYNENRHKLKANNIIPKMAQGWLSGRRWEDETNIENQKESEPNNYQPSIEDILS